MLAAQGYGQQIRDDGPTSHHTKRGTPTMGGVVIILATVVGYFVAKLITQERAHAPPRCCCCSCSSGSALVGFLDDYIKISKQRSLGLRSKAKMIGQTVGRAGLRRASRCRRGSRTTAASTPAVARTSRSSATSSGFTLPTVVVIAADLADHHRRPATR